MKKREPVKLELHGFDCVCAHHIDRKQALNLKRVKASEGFMVAMRLLTLTMHLKAVETSNLVREC